MNWVTPPASCAAAAIPERSASASTSSSPPSTPTSPMVLVYSASRMPGIVHEAVRALVFQGRTLLDAASAAQPVSVAAATIASLLLIIQLAGVSCFFYLLVARPAWRLWSGTRHQAAP